MDLIKTENCTGTYLFVCMREDRGYVVDEKLCQEEWKESKCHSYLYSYLYSKKTFMRALLSKCEMFYNGDKCRALVY